MFFSLLKKNYCTSAIIWSPHPLRARQEWKACHAYIYILFLIISPVTCWLCFRLVHFKLEFVISALQYGSQSSASRQEKKATGKNLEQTDNGVFPLWSQIPSRSVLPSICWDLFLKAGAVGSGRQFPLSGWRWGAVSWGAPRRKLHMSSSWLSGGEEKRRAGWVMMEQTETWKGGRAKVCIWMWVCVAIEFV